MTNVQEFDLSSWVEYIQTLHVREIDLSLERVNKVYLNLFPEGVPFTVVTIAGTNGKGSTAEIIASVYRAAGYQVGKYTSPHLLRFNERFNLNGQAIDDDRLLAALQRVESGRDAIRLTFFEFGTLVAIELFATANVDIAVMEVGLGGRLDAVNILQPNVSVITSIGKDHTAWLGDTVDKISLEKLGIARPQVPCIIGMREPPGALLKAAGERYLTLIRHGHEFVFVHSTGANIWRYVGLNFQNDHLPLPFGQANHQLDNAASGLCAIEQLSHRHPVQADAIKQGLQTAKNPARCQIINRDPLIILDVSHNVASVQALREFLLSLAVEGRVVAVCGMLRDKEISEALGQLVNEVDEWHFATINNERGAKAEEIKARLDMALPQPVSATCHASSQDAYQTALTQLKNDDCLVVFGSFFVVGDIIQETNF